MKRVFGMVKEFDLLKIHEVMQLWLDTNIAVHDFIPKEYWTDNYEIVKKMLPYSEILVYEEDVIYGFIGIINKSYIAGLFISKQFQKHGIGTKLLDECKKRYPCLTLDVYVKNEHAINFYQNMDLR